MFLYFCLFRGLFLVLPKSNIILLFFIIYSKQFQKRIDLELKLKVNF